ncbi:hypothetical protein RIVM261_033470 [Rivularia sp. IAM M-261]|nr:hypothetical protein CAL7716_093460 [Calothrix sp. PCC 7716]GJD18391.1 hypothetical protein RIVM261_033470 [Rivularia sp. IAM M-261]
MNSIRKFVLDTNVLVSAMLSAKSKPRQVFDEAQKIGVILMSNDTFIEAEEVLLRPKFDKYITLPQRQIFIEELIQIAQFIEVNEQINECRDPKDNKYLELAVAGEVECIITGDEDLLVLNPFRGIKILTVQEFLELLLKHE